MLNPYPAATQARFDRLCHFIQERRLIRERRESGAPEPWTTDPILARYRFCNEQREHDKTTRWLKLNWRDPYTSDPLLYWAITLARFVNRISSLERLQYPVASDGSVDLNHLYQVASTIKPLWGTAYMIRSSDGRAKLDYVFRDVLEPLLANGRSPRPDDTLRSYSDELRSHYGIGPFMAGQIVADLKYTPQLAHASDWHTWAVLGPGSRRGLNRFHSRQLHAPIDEAQALAEFLDIRLHLKSVGVDFCAQDVQHCMCELDKYQRVSPAAT